MKISDVDPSTFFRCINLSSLGDPQTESPVELSRQWTTEIGHIPSAYPEMHPFNDAFWKVPGLFSLYPETGFVRKMLSFLTWKSVNPAVPLGLIKSGLAGTSDFPLHACRSNPHGTCQCHGSSFIYQYFHALLNCDKSFHDWRCLARKVFLGVSPLDIIRPYHGAFWNLNSILEALWKRQLRLLAFERWIQSAITLWFEDLAAAGINLEEYMSLELLYSRGFKTNVVCKNRKIEIRPGARLPESGPSLVILSIGPRANDWSFSWDPCVEELSGDFWKTFEDAWIRVPGAWVDERTEDSECVLGDQGFCWVWGRIGRKIGRFMRNKSKMAIRDVPKEKHKQQMRSRGLEWTERKDGECLRIRGMVMCEPFSPGYWD